MKQLLNVFIINLLVFNLLPGQVLAKEGTDVVYGELSGYISDVENGKSLANVNIHLLDTHLGTASSESGSYLIKRIPPGKYKIEISRIGYHTETLTEVIIKPGRLTVRKVKLIPTFVQFDDVVFTATKSEQTAQMAPASISVLKSADLKARNITTFDQALETVPGITMQRTTGVSVQSVSLRGSSEVAGAGVGNRVLLAIDGRPALSSDSGGALWSLVPTGFIDRIEIVKGAFSSLYGSTAMGGVINVITKKPTAGRYFEANFTGGMYETSPKDIQFKTSPSYYNNLSFGMSRNMDWFSYIFQLSRKASEGHREHSSYEFYNLYSKFFLEFSNNRNMEITIGGDAGRNDYPHSWFSDREPLRVAEKNLDNEQRKFTQNVDVYYYAIPNPRVKYSSRFYFYRQLFKSNFNENDPNHEIENNEYFGTQTRSHSKKMGNITQLDYHFSDQNYFIAGLDLQRDLIDATPDSILYGQHQVNNIAFYAQDEHNLTDKLTLNVGLRFDHNELENGKKLSQLSPKASLVYSPIERLSLRFLAGRAFRAPSVSERFFKRETSGGTEFEPNPGLEAEKVTSLEIGSRLRVADWADIDAALFRSTYNDMLYWINIGPERGIADVLFQVRNLNEARLQGYETSVNFYPVRSFHLRLNYTYLDSEDLSPENEGTALAYKVKHTFSFVSLFKKGDWLFNLDGRYNGDVEEVFLFPNNKPDAFFVTNGKVTRKLGDRFSTSFGVNNIFDIQYEEMARYRMPGRTWILGTNYKF